MPLNYSTFTYQCYIDFRDYKGDIVRARYLLASNSDNQALADMKTLANALMLLCEGQVYVAGLEIIFTDLGADPADPLADVEQLALISCTQTPSLKPYNLIIPMPAVAIRMASTGPGYWQIDTSNADLMALLDYFKAGGIALGRNQEVLSDDGTHTIINGSTIYTEARG